MSKSRVSRPAAKVKPEGKKTAASRKPSQVVPGRRSSATRGDRDEAATIAAASKPAKPAPATGRMRVEAKRMLYYGHKRRRVGDVFELSDPKHFNPKHMIRSGVSANLVETGPNEALRREHDAILGGAVKHSETLGAGRSNEPDPDEVI